MSKEIVLHKTQANILRVLLFKKTEKFSNLNVESLSSDHFSFHINKLIKDGLILKNINGFYNLSNKGKEFANRLDTKKVEIEKQAKIGVLIVASKFENQTKKYLIQQRLKEPYFGFFGFITGKIKLGESALAAAKRELKEETGMSATVKFVGVKHKTDYSTKNILLEDKFFMVFKATNLKGKLTQEFEGGKNYWYAEKQIINNKLLFDGVAETIKMANSETVTFNEHRYKVKSF